MGSNKGLRVNPAAEKKGVIHITPHDSATYYLTVVMPVSFRDPTVYRLRLTPKGQTSPSVGFDVSETIGINHIFQFRMRGPVTLTVDTASVSANIHAIFLDPAGLIPQSTTGYQLWQQQNFANAALTNPNLSGMLADFDRDGQPNLLEYVMGTSPVRFSRSSILANIMSWQGTNYLTLQFTRDYSIRDINLRVGAGSDLTNPSGWVWINPDDPIYRMSGWLNVPAIGLETIIVRDVQAAGNGPRFMRLSVAQ